MAWQSPWMSGVDNCFAPNGNAQWRLLSVARSLRPVRVCDTHAWGDGVEVGTCTGRSVNCQTALRLRHRASHPTAGCSTAYYEQAKHSYEIIVVVDSSTAKARSTSAT